MTQSHFGKGLGSAIFNHPECIQQWRGRLFGMGGEVWVSQVFDIEMGINIQSIQVIRMSSVLHSPFLHRILCH